METLARAANRGSISTGYDIDNSVKLQTSGVNSEFFNYTISSTGDRTKGTVSMWIKRTSFGTTQCLWEQGNTNSESGRLFVRFDTDDTLRIATGSTVLRVTNRVFRDASAWYHIVVAIDTTSSTADNRTRLYVNGVEETSFSTKNNFSQNDSTGMNFEKQHIGLFTVDESSFASFDGYMAEVFGADGLVYAASDFGEFDSSGIWKPKDLSAISSSVGTNGFYMKFENAAGMGVSSSNDGHGFSVQNINQNDQATDVPSNNFATFNPLYYYTNVYTSPIQGATQVEIQSSAWKSFVSTIAVSSGKWYVEFEAGTNTTFCGVSDVSEVTGLQQNQNYIGNWDKSIGFYGIAGLLFIDGASYSPWSGFGYGDGDKIGIALDKDNGYVYMSGNGTWANSGDPTSGSSGTGGVSLTTGNSAYQASDQYVIGLSMQPANATAYANYGGFTAMTIASGNTDENGYGNFEYAPPSGYYALCTKNLAEYG
jgi:hypothetical protein